MEDLNVRDDKNMKDVNYDILRRQTEDEYLSRVGLLSAYINKSIEEIKNSKMDIRQSKNIL